MRSKLLLSILFAIYLCGCVKEIKETAPATPQPEMKQEKRIDKDASAVQPVVKPKPQTIESVFPLDYFIVSFNEKSGKTSYLKIEIKLQTDSADVEPELENKTPKIRDSIVTILTKSDVDELRTTKGKQILKESIKNKLNSFLVSGKIKATYFTDFIIQGPQ